MNDFEKTIAKVPEIAYGYCRGLKALKHDSQYVFADSRLLDGSVNIDDCTKCKYPSSNRWDYVISYKGQAYFLEVHPATNGSVKEVIAKLMWVKGWLKEVAYELDLYPSGTPRFNWVHSGKCGLLKSSKEYKKAAMFGLVPVNKLNLH